MYQLPVGNVEKIRKARKAVKNILSEIGLEDCQNLLKDLNENSPDSDREEAFQETDWTDVTNGYSRRRKKWPYRSHSVCCSMCKYSTKNIYNFRVHIARCHIYGQSACALAPCTQCLFIAHPRIVKKHMLFFHGKVPAAMAPATQQPQKTSSTRIHNGNQRYQCARCGYPSSFIFAMKKHVILKHLAHLAEQFIGYRLHQQGNASVRIYCCKECKVNTGTLDQMLHHMLVEPAHYSISTAVQSVISENKNYLKPAANGNGVFVTFPSIAPKPQTQQIFTKSSLVLPSNGQPAGTVVAVQPLQGTTNSTTLICAPGTNQAFLPPQASALVQLASAEAKGLLQPGATIALQSALPQGSSVVPLPTVSNMSLKQAPVTLSAAITQPQQTQQAQQIVLPSGLQSKVAAGTGTVSKPIKSVALQGTMLTSQSLQNHLIPTGNKVNGMPTYTFAPLQAALPVSQRVSTPLQSVDQGNSAPQTKKWITCPHCNELFPANVFDMHMEAAHPTKSSFKTETVAAQSSSLKKMSDKTVKCLTCKVLLSEKSIFQHLLHGLNCLYCKAAFFSVKQLMEHVKMHNPSSRAYCDVLRQKYRVYSKGNGEILFPYIDVTTVAPKEVIGDREVNLALVTNTLELIYFKLQPINQHDICSAPAKVSSTYCPFCSEKFQNQTNHLQHLKQKHFVAPTIHAILKTEAYKCIYCNGVYTGKVTQQAVMLHIQRCRCSPKPPQPPPQPPKPVPVIQAQPPPKPAQQLSQAPGLYFLQMPQGLTMAQALAPARVVAAPRPAQPPESEAELQSKRRLEAALKEAMEANKREREVKAAMRKKREQEKLQQAKLLQEKLLQEKQQQLEAAAKSDPNVKLALEPTSAERRDSEERRDFMSKYFNVNPYASKAEAEELSRRLCVTKGEVAGHFGKKRSKCMKTLKKNVVAVLLGFNMTELSKVKHDLQIPEQQPPDDTAESQEDDSGESPAQMPPSADAAEPMDASEAEKVPEEEQVQPME
ncbi:activity-dependent neuroprotector homeobox protein 2b [Nematolebias whitei]|uniref:activity-dependent neuroprotector homeobox protein 2b n=1 Tax=Nematolebias whitei TaxID=451745 RepID=UPI001899BA29|nr:activity-dependent neuroprotector homeobox protein 2b [Nematolebias whitei]